MDNEKKNEILSKAYTDSQDMIRLADSKANISLTIQTLLITIGLGASLLSNTFENVKLLFETNVTLFYLYISFALVFIIMSILGILITIFVYFPRESQEESEQQRRGYFYFTHVLKFKNSDEYLAEVKKIDEEALIEEYARQIYQLSLIAKKKMDYVKKSIWLLIFNICYTVFFLILCGFINIV